MLSSSTVLIVSAKISLVITFVSIDRVFTIVLCVLRLRRLGLGLDPKTARKGKQANQPLVLLYCPNCAHVHGRIDYLSSINSAGPLS